MSDVITVMAVGDLVLDEPNPDFYFEPSTEVLQSADLTIGQIEVPHTTSTESAAVDIPAPPAEPAHIAAIARAGFDVGTIAGNHAYDCGTQGVADTIRLCREAGIVPTGTGLSLDEAWTPAIVERGGKRIAVMSVNCVGPRESWATSKKAGSAYVNVLTHYELDSANPGGPPSVYSFCEPKSLRNFIANVERTREQADIVIVALHKGLGHMRADLADYEYEVARAAVDAGADAVISHHAHIMRGIEIYKGAPIFHGLGNFVTVTQALSSGDENSPERQAWAKRRKKLFGFEPDPSMPTYAFHPESRNTAIAVLEISADGGVEGSFIPCWIDDDARPVPHGNDETGRRVADYIEEITREVGLPTAFTWDGARVRVSSPDK